MQDIIAGLGRAHMYYLFASGIKFKPQMFNTRQEAENFMNAYCLKHNLLLECVECDKHERLYAGRANRISVKFYINRV